MSILGTRVLRTEDPRFLTAGGVYTADLQIDGVAYVTFVRSTVAHARISSIDTTDARSAPGVLAVFTADDIELASIPGGMGMMPPAMNRPFLATGVVRFVGEPVAVLVTELRSQAEDAAERVLIEYEPLTAVVEPDESADAPTLLFPEHGSNIAFDLRAPADDTLFDGCEVVVRQRIVNRRVAPCPLEVRGGAARWETDGRLTFWSSNQTPHGCRSRVAATYGLAEEQVHVITPDVGGGFGAKIGVYPEDLLLPWLARRLGRPVTWTETRSESMVGLGHGRGQAQLAEMGGRATARSRPTG